MALPRETLASAHCSATLIIRSRMSNSATRIAEAETQPESALALVSDSRPNDAGVELTTPEVAQQLSRSIAWVKRHARELGGHLVDGAYRFPSVAIERRRTTVERITFGGGRAQEPADLGPRTAAIFDRLEQGQSVSQIVRDLREPASFVLKVRSQWVEGYEADRHGVQFTCSCGAAANPRAALCMPCFTRARVLSDAERAMLLGADLPEAGTCQCGGCGARVPVEGATEHVCRTCLPRIRIIARAGVLVAVLGEKTLAALTVEATRDLVARELAHHVQRPAPDVPRVPSAADVQRERRNAPSAADMMAAVSAILEADANPAALPEDLQGDDDE